MSLPVARLVVSELSRCSGIETELIDIARIPRRIDDAGQAIKDPTFSSQMSRADALVSTSTRPWASSACPQGLRRHARQSRPLLPVAARARPGCDLLGRQLLRHAERLRRDGRLRDQAYLPRIDKFLKELSA